ncbi:MAG TPA: ABC transporter ATP-binding protein [Vicinamibacterales bacterium]|nr:ABC transporter ATP-binding protein [Vicinamibacterales bacterium]
MLSAHDVWFGYDARSPVLRGVSVDIASRALVGILGPNGSGKTTLLRLLAGTRSPQRGVVTLDGAPVAAQSRAALARRIAVVPQETQLAFDYSVAEVAMMGRYPHLGAFEIEGPLDAAAVHAALAATGTGHLADRQFTMLSGGEKQRVVIAAALAQISDSVEDTGTRVLLLDEPTASLDLTYQLEVLSVLQRLNAEHGLSIVISTHDLNLAASLCRTLLLIRDGRVVAAGASEAVLTQDSIRALYGVDAEIVDRPSGGRAILPVRRTGS